MAMDTSALSVSPKLSYTDEEIQLIWRSKMLNMKKAWTEFESKKLDLTSMPFKAIVELTQNCNFRCIMCPQSWEEKFKKYNFDYNMPMETFTKIADQLFPYATFIDLRGFGETTILPYWPDVVDFLEQYPLIEWHLVTNLSLPRDDTWDKMMRLGFALGFSCDGATKETFETIRVRGHFDKIRHNLGILRDAIKKHGRGWVYFISTIQKKNLHELRALVELAHEFSVKEVQFKMVQEGGHAEGLKDFNPEVIRDCVLQALDAAEELGVRVTFNDWHFTQLVDPKKIEKAAVYHPRRTSFFPPEDKFDDRFWNEEGLNDIAHKILDTPRVSVHQRCFKPFSFTYINYKAEMGTCNHMMYPDMLVMGDLKTQKLADVWNCARYQDFRSQLLTAQPKDHRCQWCFKHRLDD